LLVAGCGTGRYPVTGQVVYVDGTPVIEGTVVAEMEDKEGRVMAQGDIRSDGTFNWGTQRPGDGARPGKYRVAVLPRALGDAERAQGKRPAVEKKFTSMERSGIEFEVKEGRNELRITVTKPTGHDE
jgi:hypothetical protein